MTHVEPLGHGGGGEGGRKLSKSFSVFFKSPTPYGGKNLALSPKEKLA